jgi:hypothetical protein
MSMSQTVSLPIPAPKSIFDVEPRLLHEEFYLNYDFENCWTRVSEDRTYHDVDVAAAYLAAKMSLSDAARLLGRSRRSLELYIARSRLLSDMVSEMEAVFIDRVELLHRHAALSGDLATQRFFLTTKAKDRGYVVRNETTGKDGEALVPPSVDWSKVSTGTMKELMKAKFNE